MQQQQQQQPSRLESFFAITKSLIIRALIIYFITSFFRRPQPTPQTASNSGDVSTARQMPAFNYFENGTIFDMHVYISEDFDFKKFNDPSSLVWFSTFTYGDWYSGKNNDGIYTKDIKIQASENLMNNGSIYLHTYITKMGKSPNPDALADYAGFEIAYNRRQLNKFRKIRYQKTQNLLTGTTEKSPEEILIAETMENKIVNHWHNNLTINLIVDQTTWVKGSLPSPLDEYITFLPGGHTYMPIIFINDYWNMMRDYFPINTTTPVLNLTLTYQPLSLFKFQLYAAQTMRNKWANSIFGELGNEEQTDDEQDSLKETLLDTNAYLLAITFFVSVLHTIFELLAFKNDIQFWRERKSLEGLSVRSVFFTVFQSLIVLLYVLDNETNFMIKISCFIGLGIEVWKIQKVVNVNFDTENKWFGIMPRIWFSDKGSYVESSTKQYDNLAFKYLGWICFPLLLGYCGYSLLYHEHRGWYSFVLNMLYGFLLTFGTY